MNLPFLLRENKSKNALISILTTTEQYKKENKKEKNNKKRLTNLKERCKISM